MGNHIEMHSERGSDDTKCKKDRARISGKNTFITFSTAKMLRNRSLVYAIEDATETEASDDGACTRTAAQKLHFECRKSGSRTGR
ncbi:hypothetical protein TNCV_2568131 [Trichonephila clavipes]|uniref:Uncharacterized protein n=1 Tax=Trichonephila clavipes TaxID=2585209 RepID=A0A8X6WNC5_TRICX|nr:hypothetical protein TNCV_2568131 [Trichonephila clavipes]